MFDLAIIGGGPAGYVAAERAGAKGLKVVLFEKRDLGGVCLNEGCIPTKTLLYSAKVYDTAVHGDKYGVFAADATFDFGKIMGRKERVVRRLVAGVGAKMKAHGVTVAVEPVFYHSMNTPEAAKMVLDSIASPNLKIIFDAANLISFDDVARQEAMWDRAMTAWGDKIVAVHVKGVSFDENGDFHSTSYEQSQLDYALIAKYVRQLGKDLPIMREEVKPDHAKVDIEFLKSLFYLFIP